MPRGHRSRFFPTPARGYGNVDDPLPPSLSLSRIVRRIFEKRNFRNSSPFASTFLLSAEEKKGRWFNPNSTRLDSINRRRIVGERNCEIWKEFFLGTFEMDYSGGRFRYRADEARGNFARVAIKTVVKVRVVIGN